jgi:hypothetical protein
MKIVITMLVLPFILLGTLGFTETGAKSENLDAAISYLLSFVEKSNCTFIRNDKKHTAKEAVSHMQRKYAHFRDEIETPEDFIRLCASKSLISGKPYMIETKGGELMKSEIWLLEALQTFRQSRAKNN